MNLRKRGEPPVETGYCESCGAYQAPETPGSLIPTDDGRYVCARCYAIDSGSLARRSWRSIRQAVASEWGRRGLILGAMVVISLATFRLITPAAQVGGGVLGITQVGPSATGIRPAGASSSAAASATPFASPAASPDPASGLPSSPVPTLEPAFQLGDATAVTWEGALGEMRMEVIVPVRNVGSSWIQLPRSASRYSVLDKRGREVAGGVFTAALPAAIGPSSVGYLVDTVSVAFITPSGTPTVKADVEAVAVEPPNTDVVVTDLAASTGASGGLRVTGLVHNQGERPVEWVMAGAVLLDQEGRPLAAVYDPAGGGRLEPGAALAFDTEYPGAPPPPDGAGTTLVGIACEALDGPTK
jgi:hypothetical protein